jgi:hypothetical protein
MKAGDFSHPLLIALPSWWSFKVTQSPGEINLKPLHSTNNLLLSHQISSDPSWAPSINSHSASRTTLLGHQGLTVTPPVGLRSFHPWINSCQIRSPCHSQKRGQSQPSTQDTPLRDNKPQERISGVAISMCYPIDSNTCIEVTTCVNNSCQNISARHNVTASRHFNSFKINTTLQSGCKSRQFQFRRL